jgi:glutaredoxin
VAQGTFIVTWSDFIAWFRRPRRLAGQQIVMYTRSGCHLCETAWAQLEAARHRWGFDLSMVNVDGDPELAAKYGNEVPVVTVHGTVRFRGIVNAVLLERLLRAEALRKD